VEDDQGDPWGLCLAPEVFASQLEVLRRDFQPVRLKDASAGRGGSLPVAVTFDDGYADVLTRAVPLLERFEVPATVFVVPGLEGEGFWWDRLRGLFENPDSLPDRLSIDVGANRLEWQRDQGVQALRQNAYQRVRRSDESTREAQLVRLGEWAGIEPRSPVPVLDSAQLRDLAQHPLIEIGSHTMSHADLSALDADGLDREIKGSRDRLEEGLGRTIESFSYPHGGLHPAVLARIKEAGYRRACSSEGGLVQSGSDPFRLPRLWPPASSGAQFRAWLRGWTGH
jgi:peptidoglycan/xylan/chitin deacetylase (PgdA/CDA1 family)